MSMAIPDTARRKVIRRREWEGASTPEPVVYVDAVPVANPSISSLRQFDVYAEDGSKLGRIEGNARSITTKIKGTRLVRHGKRRMLWNVVGESWNDQESQAAAIRELLKRLTP